MDIFEIILKSFLGAVGAGILTLIILCIKWMARRISNDNLTMKAIAHDAYFRQARYLLAKDEITEGELENHNYLHRAYKAQGLNGTGDRLHEMILNKEVLPSVDNAFIEKLP